MEYLDDVNQELQLQLAAKTAFRDTAICMYKEAIKLSLEQGTGPSRLQDFAEQLNSLKKAGKPKVFMFPYFVTLTMNIRDGILIDDFTVKRSYVESIVHLQWVKSFEYSYELTQDGYIHIHGWLEVAEPIAPSDVRDRLKRSRWKQLADFSVRGNKFLQVAMRSKPVDYKNTIVYITKNNEKDIEFRKRYFLKDLYKCHSEEGLSQEGGFVEEAVPVRIKLARFASPVVLSPTVNVAMDSGVK